MPTIVISPFNVINFSDGGGHFWVYMQYAQALRRLGCEVYWLESFRSSGGANSDEALLDPFLARMERFGLRDNLILYPHRGPGPADGLPQEYTGRMRADAEAVFERADLLLNFHYAIAPALLARFRRTALVDIDPGLLQFWISRGQLRVPSHHSYFTTGEAIGSTANRVPDCGLKWIHIRPSICLELWPCRFEPQADAITTVSNWDSDDWIVDKDEVYENTKRVAFLGYSDLPRMTGQPLELALFLRTERDERDRRELESRGWRIRHSREVAGTPEDYQAYIQGSRGEFSCAKPSYVKFQNAWVSDRTLCYLASGKPAVVQDTGPSCYLPNGEGMFRFSTPKEAARAISVINSDYRKHCQAARRIAETYFDAKQIAREILSKSLA